VRTSARHFACALHLFYKGQILPAYTLSSESFAQGIAFLCQVDADLQRVHAEFGPPPLWRREPGFPTLVHLILEQQVSTASAGATLAKLQKAVPALTPENFIQLSDADLRQIGFSRQKTAYCYGLARSILDGELNLEQLERLEDAAARSRLVQLKGIGNWTADNYLLMALLRPDIIPVGDLALMVALKELKGLASRPTLEEVEQIALVWRPWRAVATRFLWHYYLSRRNNSDRVRLV
jgi:DNA-3-methyladenine glycosylase II